MKRQLLLFSLGLSLLFACQQGSDNTAEKTMSEPRKGGIYRTALRWTPKDLDPAFSTDIYSVTVIQQLFDGLVQFDHNLSVVPALATSWQVSGDGLVYTFHLREGTRFHNGRGVTAEDFVYSFTRILDPNESASALSFFEKIKGADGYRSGNNRAVDGLKALAPNILEITLVEPFAPFLSVLAMKSSKVVPREEVEKWGNKFGHHPVGTGPFTLESFEPERIVLVANPDYYEGHPYLDKVVYSIYPGAQNEKIADDFLAGRLEDAPFYGIIQKKVSGRTEYQLFRKPSLSLLFYGMNCETEPLVDGRVRKAVIRAIDKSRILQQVYNDRYVEASRILPPGMLAYLPAEAMHEYDPEKAKALLSQAGYGDQKRLPTLVMLSASKSPSAQDEFELIKEDLAAVGISFKVKYETDWPRFETLLRQGDFMLYRYAWFADVPDPDNFLGVLCSSDSSYNFMRYKNQRVDALLSEALNRVDPLKRAALYREAEDLIDQDAPIIPILYLTFESAFQPYVKGLQISALGAPYIPLKKIWLDNH
jgi:ABC-type transport system substrate-binding protein